jgi:hypothetical protein
LVAELAATAFRSASVPGLGAGTTVHAVPFQCSVRVLLPAGVLAMPTAHASLAEVVASDVMSPVVPRGRAGLAAADQAVPFHRSNSGAIPSSAGVKPAAQALAAEVAVTAMRVLPRR